MAEKLTEQELIDLLSGGLKEEIEKIRNALTDKTPPREWDTSFMEIMRLQSDEVSVSRLLAYLLDPKNDGGNPMFLKLFLEKCGVTDIDGFDVTSVSTEKYTDKGKRIDILAVSEPYFMLLIENKIWSGEHGENGDQTVGYYDSCEEKYAGCSERKYVYLKPRQNSSTPSANELRKKDGVEGPYRVMTYDDVADMLKELVSSGGHRYMYKILAEEVLLYCRNCFGGEGRMKELTGNIKKYLDNMDVFDTVENNLKKYIGAYEEWMDEIKAKVRDSVDELAENNEGYLSRPHKKDTHGIYWIGLYLNEDDFKRDDYEFYAEIHFCGEKDRKNDLNVVMQSTVHMLDKTDKTKIEVAKNHVSEKCGGEMEEKLKYILFDMEDINLKDFIKKGGDADEMSARIFECFKEYIDRKAKKISEYFKEGYFS